MYKLLLCRRYLKTRFLAFVCIISVMLGVATLVVVNSVMGGFSNKLKDRLHGLLSDIVIETPNYQGFPLTDEQMLQRIRNSPAGPYIEAMTPTIEVVAIMNIELRDSRHDRGLDWLEPSYAKITRPIRLIGVDPKGRAAIGGFSEYLTDPNRRANPSFDLDEPTQARFRRLYPKAPQLPPELPKDLPNVPALDPVPEVETEPVGIILGHAIATYREPSEKPGEAGEEVYVIHRGDVVNLVTIGVGKAEILPVSSPFVVVDYIKTEMAEYDSNFMFVPLDYLQRLRGSPGRSTHVQIKLKNYADAPKVVAHLKDIFPDAYHFQISRWEDKQATILSAISIESNLLSILLFMIVGVAGFGILAIFSMIVVEKTRDIGIMKSLGASNTGIMSIFMGYGLLLGVVGSVLGTILGLIITSNINVIEVWMSQLAGREIFPRSVYYFDKIPTLVDPWTIAFINICAIGTAVLFSILPALRAAMLKPVQALRFE